jgi:hypothetical protein
MEEGHTLDRLAKRAERRAMVLTAVYEQIIDFAIKDPKISRSLFKGGSVGMKVESGSCGANMECAMGKRVG